MKIFTNIIDIAQPTPKRFWVAPYSDFKIGIKLVKNGEDITNTFALKAGDTTFVADDDKVGGFTVYTLNSSATGAVEYTVDVDGVTESMKILQIVSDSTVFDIDERGSDMSPYATKNWVEEQISGFVDESDLSDYVTAEDLTAYATKDELTGYVENGDLTAYYTKSETSSATEIGTALEGKQPTGNYVVSNDLTAYYTKSETSSATEIGTALAGKQPTGDYALTSQIPTVNDGTLTITQGGELKGTFTANQSGNVSVELDAGGGGSAISAFDMSEDPVMSKAFTLQAAQWAETSYDNTYAY